MKIDVDPTSNVPIYVQIVDAVQRLVATGSLSPGDQLPTVRQLAVDLRVNPNTVSRAYLELDRHGVISSQQGRGTYVAERQDTNALALRREDKLRATVSHFLLEALSQGYHLSDIMAMIDQESLRWKNQHDGMYEEEQSNVITS
jgi:GntR family transcriptional regulator